MMTLPTEQGGDPRLDEILDTLLRLAAGDLSARTTPSDKADALDAVMLGLNMLMEELAARIDDLQQAQGQLRQSEKKYQELVENIDDGILVVDAEGMVTFANRALVRMFGFDRPDRILGKSFIEFVVPDEKQKIMTTFRRDMASAMPTHLLDTSIARQDGSIRHIQVKPNIIVDQGRVIGARAVIRDTTERRKTEQEIAFRASHDNLTGLPNRAMALQSLDYLLAQARRGGGFVAALFLDLDEFKLVNDTLGHDAGDELLRQVSHRLQAAVRESDVVARLGGDEFLILLASQCPHPPGNRKAFEDCIIEEASQLAQRVIDALKTPFRVNDQNAYVGTSIGISLHPTDAGDSTSLLQHADSAMYRVKETGRNDFHFYSEEMSRRQAMRLRTINELHRAIEQQEFMLLYQPVIDLARGHMVGVEALIRWATPDGKTVLPKDFIPVAEDSGLILPIGDWALEQACRQAHAWHEAGLMLHMAVNLSARQFWHGDIIAKTMDAISTTGVDKQRLELEITESAMTQDPTHMEAILHDFRRHGLTLSLDDFGTGYSSLYRLKHLPISKVKIDRSFVDGIPDDEDDTAIVTAIIQMATSLGLESLAEGVETAGQWRYLRDRGCSYGQGFFFSRPVPADEIEAMARRGQRWELPSDAGL